MRISRVDVVLYPPLPDAGPPEWEGRKKKEKSQFGSDSGKTAAAAATASKRPCYYSPVSADLDGPADTEEKKSFFAGNPNSRDGYIASSAFFASTATRRCDLCGRGIEENVRLPTTTLSLSRRTRLKRDRA